MAYILLSKVISIDVSVSTSSSPSYGMKSGLFEYVVLNDELPDKLALPSALYMVLLATDT